MKDSSICLVGMFPPPLHGMSLINEHIRRRIAKTEIPRVIDFSPSKLDSSFFTRFSKIFRVIVCFVRFVFLMVTGRVRIIYFGLSGGNGQIYDAFFVGLSRLFNKQLYLHHH